ncbi:MAG: GAF domain-containing protein [Leptolyngbyaceae cyanobacterium bins.349]|nr:GAF domain-containing protein [Leptolyngbyaceae cyanobacterium bins.349]
MTPASSASYQFEQENLLHRITNRIRRSLELQEILDAAVVEVRSFLGVDRVKIYRFHPDGHGQVIAESIQNHQLPSLLGLHFPMDDIPEEARQAFVAVRQRVIVDVTKQRIWFDQPDQMGANPLDANTADTVCGADTVCDADIFCGADTSCDADTADTLIDNATNNGISRVIRNATNTNNATKTGPLKGDCRYRPVASCHAEYLKAMGVQSSLVIPILPQESLWGLLVAHHSTAHEFAANELQISQLVADQISIAIAQATLLAEARYQAHREATINQITAYLHHLPAIDLQSALEITIQTLNGSGGRLYCRAMAKQSTILHQFGTQPLPLALSDAAIEQHILWQEYFRPSTQDATHPTAYPLANLYAEPRLRVLASAFRSTAIRGLLVIPLQYRQDFWGYLSIFRDEVDQETVWAGQWDSDQRQVQPRNSFAAWKEQKRGQPVTWTDDEVKLAQALATQFAIAIHEYELFQQAQIENQYWQQVEQTLRRQAEEDRLRVAILQRIRQSLNLETILDTTVAEVRQFLHTDRVLVYRFDANWSGMVVAESVSSNALSILGQVIYDPCFSEKRLYRPYQRGHISQITNINDLNLLPCYFDLLNSLQVKANLVVPILMNRWEEPNADYSLEAGQEPCLWGLLIAHNCVASRQWQTWEVNFLQQLAEQVAIALNQAELYQQVQLLNVDLEGQVAQRTRELQQSLEYESLLKRITDKVRDSLDEGQMLQTAVEELANGLQVSCCDCALYDLDKQITTIRYEHIRLPALPPAIGLSADMSQRPHLYNLLLAGQYFQYCMLEGTSSAIRQVDCHFAILSCPLTDDQSILGDIWLFKPKQQWFDELEIRLVQQVANQCAIALRQARLYQAAQAQVEELARLNQLKDDFLSTVSHELRTPMSSIKLATQMLETILRETGLLDMEENKATQYFQILNNECKREIGLINDLLDLTRLDAKSEPLALTAIDLALWIPHIGESFLARATEQHQHIEFSIPNALPPITTDLSYLERVLSELLNNACKYTPAGERIGVSCQFTDVGLLQLQVSNTGIEIAETERDRIFDKFYRIPNNDPWKHGGTGLGLTLVKKLVETLSGSIHVETQPNQTSFVVLLPDLGAGS